MLVSQFYTNQQILGWFSTLHKEIEFWATEKQQNFFDLLIANAKILTLLDGKSWLFLLFSVAGDSGLDCNCLFTETK